MNGRVLFPRPNDACAIGVDADPILCEQRTGGEFREVEDDSKRTGRLFTIITG